MDEVVEIQDGEVETLSPTETATIVNEDGTKFIYFEPEVKNENEQDDALEGEDTIYLVDVDEKQEEEDGITIVQPFVDNDNAINTQQITDVSSLTVQPEVKNENEQDVALEREETIYLVDVDEKQEEEEEDDISIVQQLSVDNDNVINTQQITEEEEESNEVDDDVRRVLMLLSWLSVCEGYLPPDLYESLLVTPSFTTILSMLSPQQLKLSKDMYAEDGDNQPLIIWSRNVVDIVKRGNGPVNNGEMGSKVLKKMIEACEETCRDNEVVELDDGDKNDDSVHVEKPGGDKGWYTEDNACYDTEEELEESFKRSMVIEHYEDFSGSNVEL